MCGILLAKNELAIYNSSFFNISHVTALGKSIRTMLTSRGDNRHLCLRSHFNRAIVNMFA